MVIIVVVSEIKNFINPTFQRGELESKANHSQWTLVREGTFVTASTKRVNK